MYFAFTISSLTRRRGNDGREEAPFPSAAISETILGPMAWLKSQPTTVAPTLPTHEFFWKIPGSNTDNKLCICGQFRASTATSSPASQEQALPRNGWFTDPSGILCGIQA